MKESENNKSDGIRKQMSGLAYKPNDQSSRLVRLEAVVRWCTCYCQRRAVNRTPLFSLHMNSLWLPLCRDNSKLPVMFRSCVCVAWVYHIGIITTTYTAHISTEVKMFQRDFYPLLQFCLVLSLQAVLWAEAELCSIRAACMYCSGGRNSHKSFFSTCVVWWWLSVLLKICV